MINALTDITSTLQCFDSLMPYPMTSCWAHMMPEVAGDPFWVSEEKHIFHHPLIFISGPLRNGNHLIHSMFDNHPDLCRLPGENSFLSAFFNDLVQDKQKSMRALRGEATLSYITHLSGYGHNKWKAVSEYASHEPVVQTKVWAGVKKKS